MESSESNELDDLIQKRYQAAINYYWSASRSNRAWYKLTRSLSVIVGALVTLIASLASSKFIASYPITETIFALGTPVLAAILTIITGFSQSFQWGATWQNMVLTAQQLQKEYDKYMVTPEEERNYICEADKLNNFVITESSGFFDRMLGGAKPIKSNEDQDNQSDSNSN